MSHVAFIYSSGARYVEISKWTRKGNENKKNYLDFKFNYYVNDVNNYLKFVKVLEINMGYKYGVIRTRNHNYVFFAQNEHCKIYTIKIARI